MSGEIEIFRGAGAVAALDQALVRAILNESGIPNRLDRGSVLIPAHEEARAGAAIKAAFASRKAKTIEDRVAKERAKPATA